MIVSQFTIGHSAYRGTATHHRILLTNRSDSSYTFRLSVRSREPNLQLAAAYSVERHHAFMLDTFKSPVGQQYRGRYTFSVRPDETVRLQIRPFDVGSWSSPAQSMEILGYAELTIPLVVANLAGSLEPQGDDPVEVLLHAFQVDWSQSNGFYDPAAVIVASGQAENQITPDQPLEAIVPEKLSEIEFAMTEDAEAAGSARAGGWEDDVAGMIDDPRALVRVLSYLGYAARDPRNVKSLNKLLREAGHDVRLEEE